MVLSSWQILAFLLVCLILGIGRGPETPLLGHLAGSLPLIRSYDVNLFLIFVVNLCWQNYAKCPMSVFLIFRMAPEVMQQLHGYDFK